MTIYQIIEQIAATTKRTDKEKILLREKDNRLLKKVFFAAYEPSVDYFIKKIPSDITQVDESISLDEAIDHLIFKFAERLVTGNDAKRELEYILARMNIDDAEVLKMIIARDMRCGVTAKTLNKTWTGLIRIEEFMLASPDTNKIIVPAYGQVKYDGLRIHLEKLFDTGYYLITRNSNYFSDLGRFFDFASLLSEGEKIDGEILFVDENGNFLERKKSNGLATKAIRGTLSVKERDSMVFVVWDIVDKTGKMPYNVRLASLEKLIAEFHTVFPKQKNIVRLAETTVVNSFDEIDKLFSEKCKEGHEGIVVKNIGSFWEPKRSKDVWKLKQWNDCDLMVVGWQLGTGRNKDRLGYIECVSFDGLLKVNVGSGFSDEQRDNPDQFLNRIVRICYNAKIQKKNSSEWSLFIPTFDCIREDKDVANTIGEIV